MQNMVLFDFKCDNCGRIQELESHVGQAPSEMSCECGHMARRVYQMPNVSMNKWNPNYRFVDVSDELDCDKDAKAMGFDD